MKKQTKFYLIIVLSLFVYQCSSIPETHYYLIDYPVLITPENSEPVHNIVLGVARFKAEPLYSEGRLVYRESPYEGKYYHYHRWVTAPGQMITDKAIEQLTASNLFKQVVPFPRFTQVDYVLQGRIKALEEWDVKNQWFAKVKISVELVEKQTNKLIWQRTVEKKNVVAKKAPFEVVKVINKSVQQCIEELQQELNTLFSEI